MPGSELFQICSIDPNYGFTYEEKFSKGRLKNREQNIIQKIQKNCNYYGKYDENVHQQQQQEQKEQQLSFYADRFIPKRIGHRNIELNLKYISPRQETDILATSHKCTASYWRQNSFEPILNNAFNIRIQRLLEFGSTSRKYICYKETMSDWPCKPRSRPMAFPDVTHDMPDFQCAFDYNVMDWSANDQIAMSFGQDLLIWRNQDDSTLVFSVKNPRALKYSPNGKYLAIGCTTNLQIPVLELWEVQANMEFLVADGKLFLQSVGAICCIEWIDNNMGLICGTECGIIYILQTHPLQTTRIIKKHKCEVCTLRYSPTMRYLASGDIRGNICIFDGTYFKYVFSMKSILRSRMMFDWHPWTGVDLVVAESSPAAINIIHVPRKEVVAFYQRSDRKIIIKSITFSKITGELLVSIQRLGENGYVVSEILVLSSLNRVVDILGNEDRGSLFMMWNSDGTKLATAHLDESFSIWNFCPGHEQNEKVKQRQKAAAVKPRSPLSLYNILK